VQGSTFPVPLHSFQEKLNPGKGQLWDRIIQEQCKEALHHKHSTNPSPPPFL